MKLYRTKNEDGLIAIVLLLVVSTAALALAATVASLSIGELRMSRSGSASFEQTYYDAESGLNVALYRLIADPVPGNHNFNFNDTAISISASFNPGDPYQRIIRAQAEAADGKIRTVQAIANTDAFGAGFDYAVQGGNGGVKMRNGSEIIGDIYSNGDILPAPGQTGTVSGNAWLADSHTISDVAVSGDVYANTINDSTIQGDAHYQNIDADTTVNGLKYPGSANPERKDFPIDEGDVDAWKAEITSELGATPGACPPAYDSGYYCVVSDTDLGNIRFGHSGAPVSLYVQGGVKLTLGGNIHVTGDILFDNNGSGGVIKADPALTGGSLVVISDGEVNVDNNFNIEGSGDPRSFILLVSLSPSMDESDPAIQASNNSTSIVFAALKGMLKVKNNGILNAACAETLFLDNNSKVVYNPLLMAFTIPNGGGNEVGTELGTWQEL